MLLNNHHRRNKKSKYAIEMNEHENNLKPMGHCKSSVKGKVHSNTWLPQETRKKSNR